MTTIYLRESNSFGTNKVSSISRLASHKWLVFGLMVCSGFMIQNSYAQNSTVPPSFEQQASAKPSDSPSTEPLRVGAGDLIDVEVFNTPELSAGRLRVDQFGNITLPAISHTIAIGGLSTSAAAEVIRTQLQTAQIMQDPRVTIFILEYSTQGITVLGEVRAPGTYTLLGPHSLYDALSAAGGPTPTEGDSIVITHASDPSHPVTVPVTSPNYSEDQKLTMVYPGDTVVVSRAPLVYVVGDVVHSGAYYMQNGRKLTVLEVISLAQGINRTAKTSHSAIVRKVPSGVETIHFDLAKVMQSKEANLTLLPGDVVVIPRSALRDFAITALPGVSNAVVSATAAALIVQ